MGYIQELRTLIGSRPIIMTGVTVIVINEKNEILLQKRTDTGEWGTIGGALELGESLEEAANRELYEEAGLKAESLDFKGILSGSDLYFKYPHGDEVYNVSAVYEAGGIEGKPTINNDEGLELRYFPLSRSIPGLNEMSKKILIKSGYLQEVEK